MRNAGVYLTDGEEITLYPDSSVANEGPERSGVPVVLINEYGDTDSIIVSWGAGATAVMPVMEISYNDITDLVFSIDGWTPTNIAWVNIGTNVVYLQTGFYSPMYSFKGTEFDVYWIAYKKDGSGNYTINIGGGGAMSKITALSDTTITVSITLSSAVLATDEIIIYFAGNQL
jgi:hypothetical protein